MDGHKHYKTATAHQIAARILEREDNKYKREIIYDVLKMYADECKKSLLKGERVRLSGVCTIYPEVKTHRSCFFPLCDNETHENAPYARLKVLLPKSFKEAINNQLFDNINNKIYGLEYLPFEKQQITNLKNNGFIVEEECDTECTS